MIALLACGDPELLAVSREQAVAASMQRLDDALAEVREAVVRGDLQTARVLAGTALAELPAVPGPPGAEETLRVALDDLAEAEDAARVAEALGRVTSSCAACHSSGATFAAPTIDGEALPDLAQAMNDHYLDALMLQLAVVGGDLGEVKRAGRALATLPEEDALPEVAKPYARAVREAAGRAAEASSIGDAARAVGELALACGRCHTAAAAGPEDRPGAPPSASDPHMAVHLYGAYWMGFGVYAPDERSWIAGADALATAPLAPGEAPALPGREGVEDRIHAFGRRAAATADPAARAELFGEVLATCSECHRSLPRG